MTLKMLAVLAVIAVAVVAGILVVHGHGGDAVVDWLRTLHGPR